YAGILLAVRRDRLEVVELVLLALPERDAIVEVEIVAERGHPPERPAQALLVGLQLVERSARDQDERRVARRQMLVNAVEIVGPVRAVRAAFVPVRPEHEMLDDELALVAEQAGQRHLALGRIEDVLLVD